MDILYPRRFAILLVLSLVLILTRSFEAQTYPTGFSHVKVGTVYYPTAMATAPDGRIFICEKEGRVKVFKNGAILNTPFLQVSVEKTNERGLSGIAFDPNFSSNGYVYVYYTVPGTNVHNRLSRFTANGDVAVSNSEQVLIEFETAVNSIHNGGGMEFGPDGKLYLVVGDDKVSTNAQNLNNHKGKILRLNSDGSGASGNPFTGSTAASRIWAYGFRHPYNFDIQPSTGRIYVNDVGEASWEEVNDATTAGKNFGWPYVEGNSSNTSYKNAVVAYPHSTGNNGGCAVSGGAFFNPSSTNYPSQYIGKYFFVDYCNKWINYVDPAGGGMVNFASNLPGALVAMNTGKDGNLYFLSISQNGLYKVVYSGGSAPVINQQPTNETVSQGQTAVFSVMAGGASPLTYQWYKNNVAISGATTATYTIPNAQTANQGSYKVIISNNYGNVTSNTVSLTVTSFNSKPVAGISAPSNGMLYQAGDMITFTGNGTDAEDGTLAAANFTWEIRFHHDSHYHPGPNIPVGVKSGTFNIDVSGETSSNVFYRVILYVRDSKNSIDTVYHDIFPKKSKIVMSSTPAGLQLALDGQPNVTNYTVTAVEKMQRSIEAISPQTLGNTTYTFSHWSHGGNKAQNIIVPENDITYQAVFNSAGTAICNASGSILREYWSNVVTKSLTDVPFNSPPSGSGEITSFEGPSNFDDNYGSRIRGYICPPSTGNYTFWIASDNTSELWISTNDNPANKIKRASVTGWCAPREYGKYASQQSAAIYLVAGQRYYIEAIHRESGEGDHLSVGWQIPGGALERPIPGNRLSPYSAQLAVTITSPMNNSTFGAGSDININALPSGGVGPIQKIEFYVGQNKVGEDATSPYSFNWSNVVAGNYQLTAKAINNSTTAVSQVVNVSVSNVAGCTASGGITREVWYNVPGGNVSAIPVTTMPDLTQELTQFKAPSNSGDNYGQRLKGFICPPSTGNYTFWISSDDNSELWLSTNDDPDNRQKIAYVTGWTTSGEFTKYPSQQSEPINLVAGQKYYIEALHKEGTQGDNLQVGWQIPGGALEKPIPGSRLSSMGLPLTSTITSPANNSVFNTGSNVTITAAASGGGPVQKIEFFNGSVKLGEDLTSPYTYVWNSVPDGSYTLTAKAHDNTASQATSPSVKITVGNAPSCSASGFITREVWYNIAGTTVGDIPVTTNPGTTEQMAQFETPAEAGDNYGQRLRGYICAPLTGKYYFYIASDDNSELWLSSSNAPSGKVKIASSTGWTFPREWNKYPAQKSAAIDLVAGQKYYIEALHKEGTQGDHLAVGWEIAGSLSEFPIPGTRLSPFLETAPPSVCGASIQPGSSTTFCSGGEVTLYANTGTNYVYQWKRNGVNITGANSANYRTTVDGDYQVKITYPGCTAYSAPTRVTVNGNLTSRVTAGGPTTFCSGGSVKLYGNTCSGYFYQWKRNGEDIPNANSSSYVATQSGSYQLMIIQGSSMAWSALVDVVVNQCGESARTANPEPEQETPQEQSATEEQPETAVADVTEMPSSMTETEKKKPASEGARLKVYPNPTTGLFTFDFCLEDMPVEEMEIRVMSSTGDLVYRKPPQRINGCVKENIELSSNLRTGVYILQIRLGSKVESTKLILTR
jgi:glucose/arabinose dehydrogenase